MGEALGYQGEHGRPLRGVCLREERDRPIQHPLGLGADVWRGRRAGRSFQGRQQKASEIQFNRIDIGSRLDCKEQTGKIVRTSVFSVGRDLHYPSGEGMYLGGASGPILLPWDVAKSAPLHRLRDVQDFTRVVGHVGPGIVRRSY